MGPAAIGFGIMQFGMGLWGSSAQADLEKDRIQLGYEDNLEKIRRRKFAQESTKGKAKAFSEAAGVLHTGGSSAQGYLDTMAQEFGKELDWMQKFADEARKLGIEAADVEKRIGGMQAFAGGANTIASLWG